MKPVQITAQQYTSLVPALDKAGAQHSATYEGQTIVGCEAGDNGVALTLAMTAAPLIVPAAAPVLLHINDGVGALQSLVVELARAREVAESAAAALKSSESRWQATEGRALKTDKTAAESRANTLYEAVRALAPVVTMATGDKKPVMGIEVEDFTAYEYDPAAALQWSLQRASGAVSLELSPAQSPLLLALLLDLRQYRKAHGDKLSPELFYLLNKIEGFIRLNTAEFEKLLKSGLYANEGIPGKVVTVPVAKVDKDLSFHVNAQAV